MKKILTFVAILLLTACGRSVKMSDLQYKEGDRANIFYVYYDDKAFDGEAWSDDGRSFKIIADSGIMKRLECFDEAGILFYAFDCNDRTEMYFNEKGNEITRDQARELYPNKYKHLQEVLLGEIDDIINQRAIESNRDEKPSVAEEDSEATKVAKEELSAAESEINKIHEEIYKEVQNAYYTPEPFEIHPESDGIDFDLEKAKQMIAEKSLTLLTANMPDIMVSFLLQIKILHFTMRLETR